MVCLNLTNDENITLGGKGAQALFEDVNHVIYGFTLPLVCAFGIVGNLLNLTILTRRKLQKSFRTLEQAANMCLISLAVSDLMFCVFAFPTMFLPKNDLYPTKGLLLMYRVYNTAIINVFIMISTWLTVAMSLERYLAICHPLRQDLYLTTRRIKIVIVVTYIMSFVFNVPVLWRYVVQEICPCSIAVEDQGDGLELFKAYNCGKMAVTSQNNVGHVFGSNGSYSDPPIAVAKEAPWLAAVNKTGKALATADSARSLKPMAFGSVAFRPNQVFLWDSSRIDTIYRILWAVVGNVIPLILLIYFNVCLCRKIYRSYKMRQKFKQEHHQRHENSSHVLTITLVVIVLMFFVLVAPSEIVIHAARITNINNNYTYMTVEVVMNFMQSINFSANFILYCIISPYFRKTLKYIFCCGCYNIYQVSKQWKKEFETSLMCENIGKRKPSHL